MAGEALHASRCTRAPSAKAPLLAMPVVPLVPEASGCWLVEVGDSKTKCCQATAPASEP
ncbi:MAG TPA: hypothetical protein VNL77_18005 [Roseiflexaceae bacterium]|nr:hypothetical protein [Roseiflexaceae bacterium]